MPSVLFGGLTEAHGALIKAFFEGLGHETIPLPIPNNEDFKIGKIYCNKGQCNPVYYTAGNLIRFLMERRKQGERDVEKRYVFITAGSCGPCRFGMYEAEYRKALRDAGFDNFTVIALQQGDALVRNLEVLGLSLEKKYSYSLAKTIILGDLVNNVYYKIKPYEVIPGSADVWKRTALSLLYRSLREKSPLGRALRAARRELSKLELNCLDPRPRVKITGEFFSQIQEGDASYRLPSWLIEEGAEPVVEPLTTWVDYLIWGKWQFIKERAFRSRISAIRLFLLLKLLQSSIHLFYNYYRLMLGNKPDPMTCQRRIASCANPYYNTKLRGGEGHMEVGKHIYFIRHRKAHMVISVKPFGCMPSTQSDGVQTKVSSDLHSGLFVSVETTGDAEVNMKSRILMKLQEAKQRAEEEYHRVQEAFRLDSASVQKLCSQRPRMRRASTRLPSRYCSTAANALHLLAKRSRVIKPLAFIHALRP